MERALRAVFLDAGGTLIRPRDSVGEIYVRHAAAFGVEARPAEIESAFRAAFAAAPPLAFPVQRWRDLELQSRRRSSEPEVWSPKPEAWNSGELLAHEQAWWRAVVRSTFAGRVFADFEAFFQALYEDFARPRAWELFPDAIPALERLRERGLSIGVISNFDARLVPILRGIGLARFIDSITFSSAAGFAKPDPGIFEHALLRHGVAAEEAIHAGDSEREDVQGARAAGMRAVLVRSNGAGLEALLRAV